MRIRPIEELQIFGLTTKRGQTQQTPSAAFKLNMPVRWQTLREIAKKHGFRSRRSEFGSHGEVILTDTTAHMPKIQITFNYNPRAKRGINSPDVRVYSLRMANDLESGARRRIVQMFKRLTENSFKRGKK